MDTKQFDRLTRFMARDTSRRGAVKTLAAGAVGAVALIEAADHASAATAAGEQWVQLYEAIATAVDKIDGDCAAVAQIVQDFQAKHADQIAQMMDETNAWTVDQRTAHRTAYADRIQQASILIDLAASRCGYKPGSTSPFSQADIDADKHLGTPVATPAAAVGIVRALPAAQISSSCTSGDDFCNCTCNNDFTVGNCAAWTFACWFGGCAAPPNCCWWGICVAGFDHDHCVQQCENCVNIQPSGSGCG